MTQLKDEHIWFNQIYKNHHSMLLHWFKGKLNQRHHAEDLSQEVFYRILKNHSNFDKIQEPRAWLFGVAKHVVIDFWRKQHIEQLYLDAIATLPEQHHPSLEHELCIRETMYQLYRVLEKLPSRTTQVFLLSQLDGLTYTQISIQLDISESTVKRDMKQAFLACMHLYDDIAS